MFDREPHFDGAFFVRPVFNRRPLRHTVMSMSMTAAQIIELLQLQSPTTCGYVSEPYRSHWQVPLSALPPGYDGSRPLGNVFYFLVTPDARVRLHRIRSDQMYHYYLGDPLEVLLLYADGRSEVKLVGSDLAAGMRPQLLIPGGTFHTARIAAGGDYALLGTSVWLRAEPADVEMGSADALAAAHPAARDQLAAFNA
jgi:predicted cupin superfamily sugar epimerase